MNLDLFNLIAVLKDINENLKRIADAMDKKGKKW